MTPIVLDSTPSMPGPITINLASPFLVSLVLRDHDIADTLGEAKKYGDWAAEIEKPLA